jgi:hypothetical protein
VVGDAHEFVPAGASILIVILNPIVILSEAKDLLFLSVQIQQILRFAQDDKLNSCRIPGHNAIVTSLEVQSTTEDA